MHAQLKGEKEKGVMKKREKGANAKGAFRQTLKGYSQKRTKWVLKETLQNHIVLRLREK